MSHCKNCNAPLTSRKAKVYCSNKCQTDYQYNQFIEAWLSNNPSVNANKAVGEVSNHIRRYLHEQANSSCVKCGWSDTNPTTGKVPLQINHIDGDSNNSTPDNLELICPNCHSLTPNYGSLNRGRGRKNRQSYCSPN